MPTASATKLKLVLDTNVYVSAFTHFRGVPFRLWQLARSRHFRLVLSPAIARELAAVLREDFAWPEDQIIRRTKLLIRLAEFVTPKQTATIFTGTMEADNRILECAVAGKADFIVSGDGDLQRLKVYLNIPILRPVDALRTLGG